jgi:peptidoglycan/LPS O-acetylase OafA/YrhL
MPPPEASPRGVDRRWPPPVPYIAGLDGLRALAVVAVMLYHAHLSWLPGGFLGVEVFFVISGYLITLLLITEFQRTGRISLADFWRRRARRLLPALFALLVTLVAIVGLSPGLRTEGVNVFRKMLLSSVGYVNNWYQVFGGLSYVDQSGRPPLLRHLWSLAVEEQFYLVWPIVMLVVLRVFRHRLPAAGAVFAGLAVASFAWSQVLYDGSSPYAVNRVYLGTDTRATGLLLGAALATVWRPHTLARGAVRARGRTLDLVGVAGLVILLLTHMVLRIEHSTEDPRGFAPLFRGGFIVVDVATLMVIAAVTHPGSLLGRRLLSVQPLRWIGTRSYGLYLWHWPVFQLLRPIGEPSGTDVEIGWAPALLLRLAITAVVTELSYQLVESPIRRGALGRRLRDLRGPATVEVLARRRRLLMGAGAGLVLLAIPAGSIATAVDRGDEIAQSLAEAEAIRDQTLPTVTTVAPPTTAPPPSSGNDGTATTAVPGTGGESTTTTPTTTTTATTTTVPPSPPKPLAIGDSVMLGALPQLVEAGFNVDAVKGRQFKEAVDIVRAYRQNGLLGDRVVIHLGNNGPTSQETVDALMAELADVPVVLLLTVKVSKGWEGPNNGLFYNAVSRFPNVHLLDWYGLSGLRENVFYGDGTHLREEGRRLYRELIVARLAELAG